MLPSAAEMGPSARSQCLASFESAFWEGPEWVRWILGECSCVRHTLRYDWQCVSLDCRVAISTDVFNVIALLPWSA